MKDFLDYVIKNKYVIICVSIVVVLYALGVVEFLTKVVLLILLIGIAVFVGKKLQDKEPIVKDFFNKLKGSMNKDVYYYQDKDDNKKE